MTYVDSNGQAATWLKNNPLDALYTGLMGLSFVPGLNIVASIGMMTIDLAKGDYTALAMDSLGIVIPGAAVGLKLSYDGVKAIVDGLRVSDHVANFGVRFSDQVVSVIDNYRSFQNSGNQLALATGFVDNNNSSKIIARSSSKSLSTSAKYQFGQEYSENNVRFAFSKKYKESNSSAATDLPNAHNPQRHHILQNEWAEKYLSKYGYKKSMAPTITLETGKEGYPHTIISNSQNSRRNSIAKVSGDGFEYGLSEAMQYAKQDLQKAGLSEEAINHAMSLVDDMLSHLNVPR